MTQLLITTCVLSFFLYIQFIRLYGDADYDKIEWDTKVDFIRASSLIESNPHAKRLKKWLQAYFDNAPRCEEIELDLCCLDLYGNFNSNIWKTLRDHCPPGQLISYSELAQKAGLSAGASKVVGYAINKNPFSLVVGDHRVVQSKGEIVWCDDSQRNKLRRLLVDHEISFLDSDVETELAKVRDRCKNTAASRKRAPKDESESKTGSSSKGAKSRPKTSMKRKKAAPAKKGKKRKKETSSEEEEEDSPTEESEESDS